MLAILAIASVFNVQAFAAAQDADAPLRQASLAVMDAPVAGGDPILPDITAVRGTVLGIGTADSVRIALDVHLAGTSSDTLLFPTAGLNVDSVHVNGRPVQYARLRARTAIPVRSDDASVEALVEPGDEIRVTLFYVVRSGLNRRGGATGPVAVWTAPGGIDSDWLPLPSASDDLFHADLTFMLPAEWTLVRGAGQDLRDGAGSTPPDSAAAPPSDPSSADPQPAGPPPTDPRPVDPGAPSVHTLRPVEALTARDLGFAAVRTDALRPPAADPDGSNPVVRAVGAGILDRPADSVRADLQRVSDFLGRSLSLSISRSGLSHLLIGGSPGGRVGPGVVIHGDALPSPDDPWRADFLHTVSVMNAVLSPALTRIPTTDLWLTEAVATWLSAHYVRSVHGDAAFGDVMEDLRRGYLQEASDYQRPLVWDRWSSPADLLDMHAGGRGAWTLHMLESVVGREALLSGLDAFLDLPDDRLRDSEALRESVEDYSNEDLSPFFDAWVYGAGHPVLAVVTSHDAAGERLFLRVEQVQNGDLVPALFPMSPDIRFASIEGVVNEAVRIDDPVTEVSFSASIEPNYVHLDTRAAWLFEYATPPADDDLVSMLRDDDTPASRIRTYRALARDGADSGLLFGARSVIAAETDPVARAVGLSMPAAMAPAASAERLLLEHASDPSPIIRARVLRGLGGFDGAAVGETALRAANSDSNPLVLAAAVPVLIKSRPSIAWDVIESALVTASPRHQVRLTALGMIRIVEHADAQRLTTLLEHTGPGQPFAIRRTAALEASAAFPGNQRVGRLLTEWLSAEEALLRLTALDMLAAMPAGRAEELLRGRSGDATYPDVTREPDPLVRARLMRVARGTESG